MPRRHAQRKALKLKAEARREFQQEFANASVRISQGQVCALPVEETFIQQLYQRADAIRHGAHQVRVQAAETSKRDQTDEQLEANRRKLGELQKQLAGYELGHALPANLVVLPQQPKKQLEAELLEAQQRAALAEKAAKREAKRKQKQEALEAKRVQDVAQFASRVQVPRKFPLLNPHLYVHESSSEDHKHAVSCVQILGAAETALVDRPVKTLVFLDRSGSMRGAGEQATLAAVRAIPRDVAANVLFLGFGEASNFDSRNADRPFTHDEIIAEMERAILWGSWATGGTYVRSIPLCVCKGT